MPPSTPGSNDPRRPAAKDVLPTARRLPTHPPRSPRRPPAADPGFEVIEGTTDPGFEVIDAPPRRSATGQSAPDSGFEVIDDALPPRRMKKAVEVDDDGDDAPPRSSRRRDEDDDRARKKPGRRSRGGVALTAEDEERERESENTIVEWGVPISLMVFGLGMMLFAAYRISITGDLAGTITTGMMMLFTIVYAVIQVPLTIAALMIIGMLVGIEYGTLGSAVRNLAAITFMANGIMWLGSAFDIMGFIVFPISVLITFGLFMTLFRLDVWETWISLIGLNIFSMAMKFVLTIILGLILLKSIGSGGKGSDFDPDDGPVPGFNDPGDGDDEPVNKGDWNMRNKDKRPPRDPDDDGF